MLRASIRLAVIKYTYDMSVFDMSVFEHIRHALELLDNPNHHKMMRKELTMNIFPFGNNGTDPSMVIKLVSLMKFSYFFET